MSKSSDYVAPGEGKWKFTGYHMLASMIAFFAVIVTANFTMAWFASSSWTGLVAKNGYVASQDFNKKLAAAREQNGRGWKSSFSFANNVVKFELLDGNNKPVGLDTITVKLLRPVSQDRDDKLVLINDGNGVYQINHTLAPGVWLFSINSVGDVPFRIDGRMVVNEDGQGIVQ